MIFIVKDTLMKKEFFDTNEQNDLQLLYEFNYNTRLFDKIIPTKYSAQIDATATKGGRQFAIEVKHRQIPIERYKSIMIEDYKYLELMMEQQFNNLEPIYINFCNDGVVIYNLNKLSAKPKLRVMDIKSEGYDAVQHQERRYMLPLTDAVVYKDNKLFKRMGV